MKRAAFWLLIVLAAPGADATRLAVARAADKRPMQIEDLFRFKRVSDPQISPDGKWVAYVVAEVSLEKNSTNADIWLAATDGSSRRQLTTSPKHDRHPRWSPDGKQILFESNRGGSYQLWVLSLEGGEAKQLTDIATEANTGIWSPDGKWIAFVSAVYPEYSTKPYAESNALNKKRMEEADKSPVKAKVFTRLFYRHWDSYVEDKRQHLFVTQAPSEAHGLRPVGLREPRDVTPGHRDAYPTSMTFSIGDDFTFSPDSKHLVFTAAPKEREAWSTNYDICRVPVASGGRQPPGNGDWECLTKDNRAADGYPRFSPDGKMLAYRAQKRPGFEADRWQLMVVDTQPDGGVKSPPRSVTASLDSSVEELVWGASSTTLLFVAEKQALRPLFKTSVATAQVEGLPVQSWYGSAVMTFTNTGSKSGLSLSGDGRLLAYAQASLSGPAEVYARPLGQEPTPGVDLVPRNLSWANEASSRQLDFARSESIKVPVDGAEMQMWLLKPPGFDPNKKWPLAYLVHGGPQSAWEDGWSFRWNAQLWAAQGYVVALPNPRGSTGFGQKYVDEISGDWGGKCFEDLMKGLEYLEKLPYIDKDRMAAAGASFGGYMMNWFQGNTTKFKTLITHCSVYNFESMYATTDELWFDEYEHGGPPWGKNRHSYEKHSPHRKAANFKTPMLIIHNDLDFRCPVSEGHQLFTTLQRLGVPSKFINFPDEGHWVLKPANSAFWHREVFSWLAKYAQPGGR